MESKPIYTSKTVWMNVIVALSAFLALPELQNILGADALKWVVLTQSGLNVAMRLISTGAVSFTGSKA